MTSPQSIHNYRLHLAALEGDDQAVRHALDMGADINALDEEGRTPIMCAIAGKCWQEIDASDASFMTPQRLSAVQIMLRHPHISLHCLNAPHTAANGVIPLSMAAWLNFPELVRVLLEESLDTVAVDAVDAHGATALMCSEATDWAMYFIGSEPVRHHLYWSLYFLQVIQYLLCHGARPDLRDCNSRSSVQYAIHHPQALWLCENVLRRHRWRENQSTDTIKLSFHAYAETTLEELLSLAHCSLSPLSQNKATTLLDPPPQTIFTPQSLQRSNKTLLSTLSNPSDASFLRSILFAPALPADAPPSRYPLSIPLLINRPDERGWSAIHHACSFLVPATSPSSPSKSSSSKIPEVEVLDMLYLAGADVSLFTVEEHFTPLHVLAKTSSLVPSMISPMVKEQICEFIIHLVRDLGAPLNARDKDDETCLHLAAEYNASKDVLDILLDLDRVFYDGRVSKMKNVRGLVASELASKQELLDSFALAKAKLDMAAIRRGSVSSALSDNTIRGPEKNSSLMGVVVDEFGITSSLERELERESQDPMNICPVEKAEALLAHMRTTAPSQYTLDQIEATTSNLIRHFQLRIQEAKKEVAVIKERKGEARGVVYNLEALLCSRASTQPSFLIGSANGKGKKVGMPNRESEDSQLTRVSSYSGDVEMRNRVGFHDISEQTPNFGLGGGVGAGTVRGQSWAEWFGLVSENGTMKRKKEKKIKEAAEEFGFVEEKQRKDKEKEKGTLSGAHKLKSWWKKMVAHDPSHSKSPKSSKSRSNEKFAMAKPELAYEMHDSTPYPNGREPRKRLTALRAVASMSSIGLPAADTTRLPITIQFQQQAAKDLATLAEEEGDWAIGKALRSAPSVLSAARHDLQTIEVHVKNAEQHLASAERGVERIERVMKRVLKKRRAVMEDISRSRASTPTPSNPRLGSVHLTFENSSTPAEGSPGYLGYSLSLRPSVASFASVSSYASTCSVLTTTTATASRQETHEDEETRVMRRLLLRRIEAALSATYDEVDRVVTWVTIIQDVVGGVKRRTYL